MKSYTFHVSLPRTGRTWRKIELREDQMLHDLHLAIQDAFEWDNDHLYAFFMSGKAWDNDSEYRLPDGHTPWGEFIDEEDDDDDDDVPDLSALSPAEREAQLRQFFGQDTHLTLAEMEAKFADFWESFWAEEAEAGPGNTLETPLSALNLQPKQEFMYLFDFGDEYRFKVRVFASNDTADPTIDYPRLVESVGDSPPQYRDWDDEEW
jgi:hypothetical protein